MSILEKFKLKQQTQQLREDAILDATTRILASKGFDLMTMDDVASEVGLSKPSLYKHFKSKEELVTETMIRLIDGALEFVDALPEYDSPIEPLKALLRWALEVRLAGSLPFLPSASTQVRHMLTRSLRYVTKVLKLHNKMERYVQEAKKKGFIAMDLPTDVVLYSFYARTCDPSIEYLKLYSKLEESEIIEYALECCFNGLLSRN
jgi:AcrR family transcriptional regulator